MIEKRKGLETRKDREQFEFNLKEVEGKSLGFLDLACEFFEIYKQMQQNLEKKQISGAKLDKKTRRKSIQKMIRAESTREDEYGTIKQIMQSEGLFDSKIQHPGEMSFMIESEKRASNFASISGMIGKSLEKDGLDTTIAFMSSEDEADETEIHGFAQQINTEFLRKDLYEIYKDFNEISVLLFSKNLKIATTEYRNDPEKFKKAHFKSKPIDNQEVSILPAKESEFSNRVLSESIRLDSEKFQRMSTIQTPGKETQLNRELAKMYRDEYRNKDRWIEWVFWGFLAMSVVIIIVFIALFYCNVFSS